MEEELTKAIEDSNLDWQDIDKIAETITDESIKKKIKDIATKRYHYEEHSAGLL